MRLLLSFYFHFFTDFFSVAGCLKDHEVNNVEEPSYVGLASVGWICWVELSVYGFVTGYQISCGMSMSRRSWFKGAEGDG